MKRVSRYCIVSDRRGSSVCEWFLIIKNKILKFSQLESFNNIKGCSHILYRKSIDNEVSAFVNNSGNICDNYDFFKYKRM